MMLILWISVGRTRLASSLGPATRFPTIERLTGFAMFVSYVLLAVSGFLYVFYNEPRMTGNPLMVHTTAGAMFAGFILIFGIMRADSCRFAGDAALFSSAYKINLWMFLLCAFILIVTAVVPMLPWLGYHGQETSILIHRYGAAASVFFGTMLGLLSLVKRR